MNQLVDNIIGWAYNKGLTDPDNAPKQMLKVMEEVGETAGALAKGNAAELKDGIGDSFVTLIILAKQCGFTPEECLEAAWSEIKDRKGKMKNGVFVKEADLNQDPCPQCEKEECENWNLHADLNTRPL